MRDSQYVGKTSINGSGDGHILFGKGANVLAGADTLESILAFNEPVIEDSNLFRTKYVLDRNNQGLNKMPEIIVMGTNSQARTGGVVIGSHRLSNFDNIAIGDTTTRRLSQYSSAAVTSIGTESYVNGSFTAVLGPYNAITSNYTVDSSWTRSAATKAAFSSIIGSFNSNENMSGYSDSGIANFIGGTANKVTKSNGAVVLGAGNKIADSYASLSGVANILKGSSTADRILNHSITELQDKLAQGVKDSSSGGAVLAIGGGNSVDKAISSQVTGVNNSLKSTTAKKVEKNYVSGVANQLTDTNNTTVIGSANSIEKGDNIIAFGNKLALSGVSNMAIVGGSQNNGGTTANQGSILGFEANVTAEGGVALGYKSVANTASGIVGYVPTSTSSSTAVASRAAVAAVTSPDPSTSTWTSTAGAVSVGDVANNITRQITGVAAGTEDTDAVNVAQLKEALKAIGTTGGSGTVSLGGHAKVMATDNNIKVETKVDDQNGNTYSVSLNDKMTLGDKADSQITIDGTTGAVTMGEKVTLHGKTGDAKFGDTLTINNTNHTATVGKVTITGGETNTITNLANTTWNPNSIDRTRVATEGQLSDVYNEVHQQGEAIDHLAQGLTDVREDLKDVGAEAAAMAGLKPLQYDPLQPTQLMASVGNYRGSTALAIGVGHYVNERFMMHAAVSAASKHAMMNAGVSWKFGFDRKRMDEVPDRYKAGPISSVYVLQDEVTQLRAENDDLRHELRELREMVNALVGTKSTK